MKPINVSSEIAPLKEVLVHRPGSELLNLMPSMLEELLFDDIPYLEQAQLEHDAFTSIMRAEGVQVTYLTDLLVGTFEQNPELLKRFLKQFIREGGVHLPYYQERLLDFFLSLEDVRTIMEKTMAGVTAKEVDREEGVYRSLSDAVGSYSIFLLKPMPNLYFTRDNMASVGHGVIVSRMFSETRKRETIYTDYIIDHHPRFAGKIDKYYRRNNDFSIEGGDILSLSPEVVAIGISQRTSPEAIETLAKTLLIDKPSSVKQLLAIQIPNSRAYMHLDTVFTQIDHNAFTYHPGMLTNIRFFILSEKKGQVVFEEHFASLEDMLKFALDLDSVSLYPCARGNLIAAEREQWNDGSNTLAISPGVILTYNRNNLSNDMLREAGFHVHELPSYELSRGRGGPRCMSMPLIRRFE